VVKFDSSNYWKTVTWDRYAELAKVPEEVRNEFISQESLFVSSVCGLADTKKAIKVLDLACGTGKISESIIKKNNGVVSLTLADFNESTLNQAKTNLQAYDNIDYCLLDAYKIGDYFPSEFDVIMCMDLLHHISNLALLLEQISRALKPGGFLLANVFDKVNYNEWDRVKYGYIKSTTRRLFFSLSNQFYPYLPGKAKYFVDKNGLARICPLTENEVLHFLSPYFSNVVLKKSYYIWFSAAKTSI